MTTFLEPRPNLESCQALTNTLYKELWTRLDVDSLHLTLQITSQSEWLSYQFHRMYTQLIRTSTENGEMESDPNG